MNLIFTSKITQPRVCVVIRLYCVEDDTRENIFQVFISLVQAVRILIRCQSLSQRFVNINLRAYATIEATFL